jgi:hypothetical protein
MIKSELNITVGERDMTAVLSQACTFFNEWNLSFLNITILYSASEE